MFRIVPFVLAALAPSAAFAQASWQDEVLAAVVAADPQGGWTLAPVTIDSAATSDLVIEVLRDGSTAAAHKVPNVTLKRGLLGATSPDGAHALLVVLDAEVCDDRGCSELPSIDPDEIDYQGAAAGCMYPLCGGLDVAALAATSPAWVVADVVVGRNGAASYVVRDVLVGIATAVAGVEPDEID